MCRREGLEATLLHCQEQHVQERTLASRTKLPFKTQRLPPQTEDQLPAPSASVSTLISQSTQHTEDVHRSRVASQEGRTGPARRPDLAIHGGLRRPGGADRGRSRSPPWSHGAVQLHQRRRGTQQDASACVDYLRARGSTPCCHTGSVEGGCTTMAFAGTTRVDICGEPGTCTACDYAGDTLNVVLAKCVATVDGANRVAGYITSKTGEFLFVMS